MTDNYTDVLREKTFQAINFCLKCSRSLVSKIFESELSTASLQHQRTPNLLISTMHINMFKKVSTELLAVSDVRLYFLSNPVLFPN